MAVSSHSPSSVEDGAWLTPGSLKASVAMEPPIGWKFREGLMDKDKPKQSLSQDLMECSIPALLEQHCQRLEESLTRHNERLEESLTRHFEASLTAAALHDLQCQEAKRNGLEMPLPRTMFDVGSAATTNDSGHQNSSERDGKDRDIKLGEEQQLNPDILTKNMEQVDTGMHNPEVDSETSAVKKMLQSTLWEMSEMEKQETDHSWYRIAFDRAASSKTDLHHYLIKLGLSFLVPDSRPNNSLVRIIDTAAFHVLTALAILANTLFCGYEASQSVSILLDDPFGSLPEWWGLVDLGFIIFFVSELAIRLLAFRLFFFVEHGVAVWNLLDLFTCTISVAASRFDLVFIRLLRIFRLVRFVKVLFEIKALSQLRDLFYAVNACLVPLLWAVLFLLVTMFMFSLLILQCISDGIRNQSGNSPLLNDIRMHFEGFQICFKTLFIVVAGSEWVEAGDALSSTGMISSIVMPLFVVFVNIGIMNIVIGVFADAAAGCKDRLSIASTEIDALSNFAADMVDLASGASNEEGVLDWEKFKEYFYRQDVQAYLSYHGLDSSHVQLIYHLVDSSRDGNVDLQEFVIGMLRLRGDARKLDQRVMSRVLMHGMQTLTHDSELIYQAVQGIKGHSQV